MPRLLSKNNRVLALIGLMAISSFGIGLVVYSLTSADANALDTLTARVIDARALSLDLADAVQDQEAALDDYVLSQSPLSLDRFTEAVEREDAVSKRLDAATAGLPEVASTLRSIEVESLIWRSEVATAVIQAVAAGDRLAMDGFAARSAEDHDAVETGVDTVGADLARADGAIELKREAVDNATTIGIVVAFAFMIAAFGVAMFVVRRFGIALEKDTRNASVLNRFTEVTSFAADDREVATANLIALRRLVRPDASVTHILNRSLDRAIPESSTGGAPEEVLPLRALDRCAGVVRGTMYVTDDLSDDLAVHCPIYPAAAGTLACIPLASGESVGAVHLYWRKANALPLESRPDIARITEHAALAIGNRRLMAALHGQANTDPRTGLANSRAFDLALEGALVARAGHESVSVLMLDVDQFKQFNDRHGHPAGDEALRVFGGILRSCMRDGDVAARYGGEEFAVLLPTNDGAVALAVAERIRARTEATIISLAPGVTDRITVSIGVASCPEQGLDRVTLLRLADEALYQAKAGGRNRVSGHPGVPLPIPVADPGHDRRPARSAIRPAGKGRIGAAAQAPEASEVGAGS